MYLIMFQLYPSQAGSREVNLAATRNRKGIKNVVMDGEDIGTKVFP